VHPRHSDTAGSAGGPLGRLIATETRLDALVADARGRAAALLEAARQEAEALARELDAELARLEAERRTTAATEMERRGAEIEQLTVWLVDRVVTAVGPS